MKPIIVVISPPENQSNEIELLCQLFDAGLSHFHIRKPSFTATQLEEYIQNIPEKYHPNIVLHSNYQIVKKYNLKGVHLTETARKDSSTNLILQQLSGKSVSASFHSMQDIERICCHYDYVFLSPIFDSISKENYKSSFSEAELEKFLSEQKKRPHNLAIVALGGIDASNAEAVIRMGFSGVALLGAIWESSSPIEVFKWIYTNLANENAAKYGDTPSAL